MSTIAEIIFTVLVAVCVVAWIWQMRDTPRNKEDK